MTAPRTRFGLTPRQAEALNYIAYRLEANGVPPTLREIADRLKLKSLSGVRVILDGLRERGHIDWLDRKAHSLTILPHPGAFGLPAELEGRLADFCAARGERIEDVVTDAVMLHLDALTTGISAETEPVFLTLEGDPA